LIRNELLGFRKRARPRIRPPMGAPRRSKSGFRIRPWTRVWKGNGPKPIPLLQTVPRQAERMVGQSSLLKSDADAISSARGKSVPIHATPRVLAASPAA